MLAIERSTLKLEVLNEGVIHVVAVFESVVSEFDDIFGQVEDEELR